MHGCNPIVGGASPRTARYAHGVATLALSATLAFVGPLRLNADEAAPEPTSGPTENAAVLRQSSTVKIAHWIDDLDDDSYTIRQTAAERLLRAGPDAREPLLQLVDIPEPETRAAARRLVALIDRSELQRRIDEFAADTEGQQETTLPGWDQFRALVGHDRAARSLFVEMQRHESAALSAIFTTDLRPRDTQWEERLASLIQWQGVARASNKTPPLGTCATMLFLSSVAEMNVSDRSAAHVENLIQFPPLRENLQTGPHRDALRKLVIGWVLHCPSESEAVLARRLNMASINRFEECVPWAIGIATGDGAYARLQPTTRAMAILLIGQLGKPEHVDSLEPLLDDPAVCAVFGPGQPAASVQICDVAMIVMTHLTGQQPADYGYVHARLQPQQMFQLQTLSIENDERRAQAIAKWRAWREEQKSREPRAESPEPKSGDAISTESVR